MYTKIIIEPAPNNTQRCGVTRIRGGETFSAVPNVKGLRVTLALTSLGRYVDQKQHRHLAISACPDVRRPERMITRSQRCHLISSSAPCLPLMASNSLQSQLRTT